MSDSNCNTCKKTPIKNYETYIKVFAAILLITSIYGTVSIIKDILSYF